MIGQHLCQERKGGLRHDVYVFVLGNFPEGGDQVGGSGQVLCFILAAHRAARFAAKIARPGNGGMLARVWASSCGGLGRGNSALALSRYALFLCTDENRWAIS